MGRRGRLAELTIRFRFGRQTREEVLAIVHRELMQFKIQNKRASSTIRVWVTANVVLTEDPLLTRRRLEKEFAEGTQSKKLIEEFLLTRQRHGRSFSVWYGQDYNHHDQTEYISGPVRYKFAGNLAGLDLYPSEYTVRQVFEQAFATRSGLSVFEVINLVVLARAVL